MARRRADACYRELGAELRKRRIAANLTMRELAYHLDWSPSTVSRVESGYIGLPTTEVLPPPRSSRAIRFSGSAANTSVKAVLERLRDAEPTTDFWQAQAAVFELLSWLASLDWRVREVWVPEGEPLGEGWYRRAPGLLLVPSLRYIRNSAQHAWTRVIARRPDDDARVVWADPPASSRHRRGDERYRRQLAGRLVAPTLGQVLDGFRWLALILEPPMVNPAAAARVAASS